MSNTRLDSQGPSKGNQVHTGSDGYALLRAATDREILYACVLWWSYHEAGVKVCTSPLVFLHLHLYFAKVTHYTKSRFWWGRKPEYLEKTFEVRLRSTGTQPTYNDLKGGRSTAFPGSLFFPPPSSNRERGREIPWEWGWCEECSWWTQGPTSVNRQEPVSTLSANRTLPLVGTFHSPRQDLCYKLPAFSVL